MGTKRIKEPKRIYPTTKDIGITWTTNDYFKFDCASVKAITPKHEIHVCLTQRQARTLAHRLVSWLETCEANKNVRFESTCINLDRVA
jgi:hypothetical protein